MERSDELHELDYRRLSHIQQIATYEELLLHIIHYILEPCIHEIHDPVIREHYCSIINTFYQIKEGGEKSNVLDKE